MQWINLTPVFSHPSSLDAFQELPAEKHLDANWSSGAWDSHAVFHLLLNCFEVQTGGAPCGCFSAPSHGTLECSQFPEYWNLTRCCCVWEFSMETCVYALCACCECECLCMCMCMCVLWVNDEPCNYIFAFSTLIQFSLNVLGPLCTFREREILYEHVITLPSSRAKCQRSDMHTHVVCVRVCVCPPVSFTEIFLFLIHGHKYACWMWLMLSIYQESRCVCIYVGVCGGGVEGVCGNTWKTNWRPRLCSLFSVGIHLFSTIQYTFTTHALYSLWTCWSNCALPCITGCNYNVQWDDYTEFIFPLNKLLARLDNIFQK